MVESFDGPDATGRSIANADATLASLAFINVTWEAQRTSYLDNFVPYALEALRVSGPLAVASVAEFIADRFGLAFPTNVVQSLLERGVKSRKVSRDLASRKFVLAAGIEEKLPDLVAKQQEHKREQVHLVRGLVAFAAVKFDLEWPDEKAEEVLVTYVDHQAVPLLAATQRGTTLAVPEQMNQGSGYVVARFVASIVEGDPVAFGYLDGMVKGSMLASVLYVDTTGQTTRRFKKTVLYLDTPICLRALGHEGEDAKKAVRQMLGLALSQGAELACFEHNMREMRGVLEGAKGMLRRARGSETAIRGVAAHFRETQTTPADVDLAIATLERDLRERQIWVRSAPDYTLTFGVDEQQLEEVLQKRVRYRDEGTRLPDVKSLTAIHRIREGGSGPHLETCRAVFVTNNSSLVRASREFFDSGRHGWPVAMVDHALSTLLWVKAPNTAPELPRLQVLADCYSALSPSASLWAKIGGEIERLANRGEIAPDSVALLRYSHEAEQALMDVTLGDPNRVSEGAIQTALERARAKVAEPAREAAERAQQQAVEADRAEVQSRFEAQVQAAENNTLYNRITLLEERDAARRTAIETEAMRRGAAFARVAKWVSWILLVFGSFAAFAPFFPDMEHLLPEWFNVIVRVAGLILAVVGFIVLLQGGNVFGFIDRWQRRAVDKRLQREGLQQEGAG